MPQGHVDGRYFGVQRYLRLSNCTVKNKRQLYQQYWLIFEYLNNKLISAIVWSVAASTLVAVMPRVPTATAVVVLELAASFQFVVAETGAADQCSPIDVLHPNRVALFSAGFPQV